MDDTQEWQAPELDEQGQVKREEMPLTITGILQAAKQPRPDSDTALRLVLEDHELADAGIPVTVRNGAGLGKPAQAFAEPKEAGVPVAPPGVSVDDNMRRARVERDTIMNAMTGEIPASDPSYGIMSAWFPTGHEMDYKKDGGQYRDFGNFNYGAVGTALGIEPYMLHGAAGIQQYKDKRWESGFGYPFISGESGDNERDYNQIDNGIGYERTHRPR